MVKPESLLWPLLSSSGLELGLLDRASAQTWLQFLAKMNCACGTKPRWAGGKEDALERGARVLGWGPLFIPVSEPVYPGTMLELSLLCPRLTGRLLLQGSGDLGG